MFFLISSPLLYLQGDFMTYQVGLQEKESFGHCEPPEAAPQSSDQEGLLRRYAPRNDEQLSPIASQDR
jgi:hypothetical protein